VFPSSYPTETRGPFRGVKAAGRGGDHSSPSSAEVKRVELYPHSPKYALMAWCSVKVQGLYNFRHFKLPRNFHNLLYFSNVNFIFQLLDINEKFAADQI
jgi:hypothetical protein